MRKYLVFSLIVFVLSFGCNTNGSKNSDGTANGSDCPVCDVCPVCPYGENIDGTCKTYTPVAAPIISDVKIGSTTIFEYQTGTAPVCYTIMVYLDKQVSHSMISDGKTKGVFVARIKDSGGLEPITTTTWDVLSSGWYTIGANEAYQFITVGQAYFTVGKYVITIIVGDELVTTYTAMFYII